MKYVCCAVSDFLRLRVPLTVPPLATVKDSALGVNWMFCASADDPPVPKSQNQTISIRPYERARRMSLHDAWWMLNHGVARCDVIIDTPLGDIPEKKKGNGRW
jgi:hypothetical protein